MRTLDLLIGLSWIAFWLYWIARAARSKPNARGGYKQGVLVRIFLVLPMAAILFGTLGRHVSSGYIISDNRPWLKVLGVILLYGGLGLAIWARKYLGSNWGVPMSVKKDPQLVTAGPYKYIRHPIYTGLILAPLGTFFVLTFAWLLVWLLGSTYFVYSALQEDKIMAKQFPKTYPAYKHRTKLLIPYIF